MSRYNWYKLLKDDKIVGFGGVMGQGDWRNSIIRMNYVHFYIDKMADGQMLDEFEIVWSHHEWGSTLGIGMAHRGVGVARFSNIPPTVIDKYTMLFKNVIFERKECQ